MCHREACVRERETVCVWCVLHVYGHRGGMHACVEVCGGYVHEHARRESVVVGQNQEGMTQKATREMG